MKKSIGIIGAGIAGLTAAYKLLQRGFNVEIFEIHEEAGGLASSFDFNGTVIERYYHFICLRDHDLVNLAGDLGIKNNICWFAAPMGFFYEGKPYPFTSPMDLMKFSPIGFFDRFRFGLNIFYSRNIKNWKRLEKINAQSWLVKHIGQKAYDVIWEPLIRVKFGTYADQISAAWIWHRINRVAKSRKSSFDPNLMGYFDNGTATLVNALVDHIIRQGGKIHLNTTVSELTGNMKGIHGIVADNQTRRFDAVISTVPVAKLASLVAPINKSYADKLAEIKFIGVVCMILNLDRSLSPYFWLNINDSRISFNGIIEYSNLNQKLKQNGTHIAYIPFYLPVNEERFTFSDKQLFDEYTGAMKYVNPQFDRSWIKDYKVFRDTMAQVICTRNFSTIIPSPKSPLKGLYITDSSQLYPEDRTISGTIKVANEVAQLVAQT